MRDGAVAGRERAVGRVGRRHRRRGDETAAILDAQYRRALSDAPLDEQLDEAREALVVVGVVRSDDEPHDRVVVERVAEDRHHLGG